MSDAAVGLTPAPGSSDLAALLAGLDPYLHDGTYVFCRVDVVPAGVVPVVTVAEDEGLTVVTTPELAGENGWVATFPCAWITLRVHSSLAAVGLTATVAGRLAEHGIPANVVAGFHHDHLFVPVERAADAMRVLAQLREDA